MHTGRKLLLNLLKVHGGSLSTDMGCYTVWLCIFFPLKETTETLHHVLYYSPLDTQEEISAEALRVLFVRSAI